MGRAIREQETPARARLPTPLNCAGVISIARDEAGREQEEAHDRRGGRQAAAERRGCDPVGLSSVSVASPLMCGMTATPVSKPDMPSASFGNEISANPTARKTLFGWPIDLLDDDVGPEAVAAR